MGVSGPALVQLGGPFLKVLGVQLMTTGEPLEHFPSNRVSLSARTGLETLHPLALSIWVILRLLVGY